MNLLGKVPPEQALAWALRDGEWRTMQELLEKTKYPPQKLYPAITSLLNQGVVVAMYHLAELEAEPGKYQQHYRLWKGDK